MFAVPRIIVGEEDAAEDQVPSWLQLRDGGRRTDVQQGQVDVSDAPFVHLASVRTGVVLHEVSEDQVAIGRDVHATGSVRVGPHPPSLHLMLEAHLAASEEGPADGGAVLGGRRAREDDLTSAHAVHEQRFLLTPHTWKQKPEMNTCNLSSSQRILKLRNLS